MTLLSRKVDYALLILAHLHQQRDGGCARVVADHYGLSRAFVANILKSLCHKGFVVSQRGANGGYALARPADQISVAELMEALDDSFHLTECSKSGPAEACAVTATCPVRGPMAELHRRMHEMLRTVMLADLFRTSPTAATQYGLLVSPPRHAAVT